MCFGDRSVVAHAPDWHALSVCRLRQAFISPYWHGRICRFVLVNLWNDIMSIISRMDFVNASWLVQRVFSLRPVPHDTAFAHPQAPSRLEGGGIVSLSQRVNLLI
jgi:hypothetical protein